MLERAARPTESPDGTCNCCCCEGITESIVLRMLEAPRALPKVLVGAFPKVDESGTRRPDTVVTVALDADADVSDEEKRCCDTEAEA